MFDAKLEVRPYQVAAIQHVTDRHSERLAQTVANRPDITWIRDERKDIDYSGYKRYHYEFKNPDAEDKELYHAIISAPTMDAAIDLFMTDVRGPDWYQDATISVTVIGIDLRKDNTSPWVVGDE